MMKIYTALAILVLGVHAGLAQDAASTVKVDGAKLQIASIQTPTIQSDAPNKRWRPKNWLEVDLELEVKGLPKSEGGRNGSLAAMTVNYYLALAVTNKAGKREVIKGSFNYVDAPAGEKSHALAYVSPATLRRIFQKDTFTAAADIQGWGYEILVDGKRVGGDSSLGGAWWEKGDFAINEGVMLSKAETPFGILWGDYDLAAKKP